MHKCVPELIALDVVWQRRLPTKARHAAWLRVSSIIQSANAPNLLSINRGKRYEQNGENRTKN